MVHFPILHQMQVDNFGLFPGSDEHTPGPHIDFQPGLTLIVGANGLGKDRTLRRMADRNAVPLVRDGTDLNFTTFWSFWFFSCGGNRSPRA